MTLKTKRRKKNHLFLTIIIICMFVSLQTINLTATETINDAGIIWYVGGNGPGNFSKIQEAIDNASAGDTIFVFNGTYYENIMIHNPLNLQGIEKETTIIDGSGMGSVITISANDVTIFNFTIQHAKNDSHEGGISIFSCNNIHISNTVLINNPWFGLIILGTNTHNTRITNNKILSNRYGAYLKECEFVTIADNIFSENNEGVYFVDSNVIYFTNNTITNNEQGIHGEQLSQSLFEDNHIANNANGIFLFNSTHNMIRKNTVDNNEWYGVWLRDSAFNNITKNYVNKNIDYGVFLDYSDYNIIQENTITNNDDGIYLEYSSYTTVSFNTLKNDKLNAYFTGNKISHFMNRWKHNFWDRPRYLPYIILGQIKKDTTKIPIISFDFTPLKNPYLSTSFDMIKRENTTWYVGGNGPGNFSKIQDAVDNATAGDIIYVFNKTYYETVQINKKLSIIGEHPLTTIIEANGTRDVFIITADEVLISGFTIQNGHFGIQYQNASHGIIQKNQILTCLHGITLRYCKNIQILNNSFIDNQYGIRLYDTTKTSIMYNVLNSYKLEGFFLGTSLKHAIHFWKHNHWEHKQWFPAIIWGRIWFGNHSLLVFNIDLFPI